MGGANLALGSEELENLLWEVPPERLRLLESNLRARLVRNNSWPAKILADLSDEVLAIAIQKDLWVDDAFQELFAVRGKRYLAAWFFRWGVRYHEAQDLIQDLLVRFWKRRIPTYCPERGFQAYLRQSAWNLLQERRRRRHPASFPNEWLDANISSPEPVEEVIGRELEERIESAILALPPDQKEALRRILEGQSADAIAAALQMAKSRVYRLVFQARRQVESSLRERE